MLQVMLFFRSVPWLSKWLRRWWELAEGDGEEADVRRSGEGSGEVLESLDHSVGGALDASARNVHAADSLSYDVAGKMSLEEEAILNNLDNLPDPADRSKLVRNLENIIHRTETDG